MLPRRAHWMSLALCTLVAACATSSRLTVTGKAQPPRRLGCDFQLYTTPPSASFVEIGTIDVDHSNSTDLASFKEEIAYDVCKAGGDAAIAYANGLGLYIKAAVLKLEGAAAPTAAAAKAPADEGCRYDTQCKGDRICVDGRCASPSK